MVGRPGEFGLNPSDHPGLASKEGKFHKKDILFQRKLKILRFYDATKPKFEVGVISKSYDMKL